MLSIYTHIHSLPLHLQQLLYHWLLTLADVITFQNDVILCWRDITLCDVAVVADSGSSSALTDMLQQAVNAIGSYRSVLQNQLPAPVSSLTDLKSVTGLDTALAGKAATYVLDKLGSSNYDQVRLTPL